MKIGVELTKDKLIERKAIVQPDREEAVLAIRGNWAESVGISANFAKALFRTIMDESVRLQREYWLMNDRKRILTGMRPTGALHLGHYVGALETWLKFQDDHECFFLIADYQALGDHLGETERIRNSVLEVALDWLAVGLDPEKSSFVVQSYIPEHAELALLFSMLVSFNRLMRNPTLKKEMAEIGGQPENLDKISEKVTVGFFNYPVSQAADILLPRANLVPVGEDQLPHIELTKEIARRFNRIYGEIFPVPEYQLGRIPRLVGTDGNKKMGKSLGNVIQLKDSSETVREAVMGMFTDPTRKRATDPGHVEGNPVFVYHDIFNPNKDEVQDLKDRYVQGRVGDVEVKEKLTVVLNNLLGPIRERRAHFASHPKLVREALFEGTERERKIAKDTMSRVREAMKIVRYGE